MVSPRFTLAIKYVLWAVLVAAIAASAGKLKNAHFNFTHNEGLAWLCAVMYALVLIVLTFAPKLLTPARRGFATVFVICLRIFVALSLGAVYASAAIQNEMVAAGLVSQGSKIGVIHIMTYVLSPPWSSSSLSDVLTYAGGILLIDLFEAILEGVNHE